MRKFTKEISALLATVAMGAAATTSAGVISAASETQMQNAEKTVLCDETICTNPEKVYERLAGVVVSPNDPEEILPPDAGVAQISDEEIETKPPYEILPRTAGVPMMPDSLINDSTLEEEEETLPPEAGEPMPPDEYIEVNTVEYLPPTAGLPMIPDELVEPTTEPDIPVLAGLMMPPIELETEPTTLEEIPPLAGDVWIPDGDINGDGELGMSDLLLLQKWLMNKAEKNDMSWWNADLSMNGRIDVFDMVMLRQEIVKSKSDITLEDLIRLSKKGYDLKVSDFRKYNSKDIGSGIWIDQYNISDGNDMFEFIVGHLADDEIIYSKLISKSDSKEQIDIRDGDIASFIEKNNTSA